MSQTTGGLSQNVLKTQNFDKALKYEALPAVCLLTLIFSIAHFILALIDIISLSKEYHTSTALIALATGIVLLCFYFLLRYEALSINSLQIILALIVGLTFTNSLYRMWILGDLSQSTIFLIVLVALGSLFLSAFWALALFTLAWAGWIYTITFISNYQNSLINFGFALFLASIVAITMHHLHYGLFKNLVDLRSSLSKQSIYLEAMMEDITQSQERFRRLANASFEGIVIHDQNKILDASDSFGKMFNVEVENIIDKNILDFFANQSAKTVKTKLQSSDNETFEAFAKKGKNIFPVEVMSYDLPYEDGVIHVASLKDITQRKDNEAKLITYKEKLEQQNTELVRANKLKSAFLATMSHELRTPLTAITGYAEVLFNQDFGPLNEDQRQYSKDIYDAGMQLMDLINRIFDLSRLEADKVTLHLQNTDLDGLMQSSLVVIRPQADVKGISLEVVNSANNKIFADPVRIKQVLYNYLSNAIKFTPQSGSVKIVAEDIDNGVQVKVVDTGIGIAEKDISQLFQPFFQLDNAVNRAYEGAGLGLSLSKRLVELQGGKVWVKSTKGQGSTFAFWLPKSTRLTNTTFRKRQ